MSSPLLRRPVLRLLSSACIAGLALLLPACKKADTKAADAATAASATPAPAGGGAISTDEQKVSYGIGYNMGAEAAHQTGLKIDAAAFKMGIDDGVSGAKTRLAEAEIQAAFQTVRQRLMQAAAEEAQKQGAAGVTFLEKNKTRAGVTTTASGLQYEVLKAGSGGAKPTTTNTVEVSYHGTLIDGTVFDSSVERGDTATFAVGGVIPGWTEALQLMSVGDKWKLFIPANLAYGPRANGKIPANAVLVFEVELKAIK